MKILNFTATMTIGLFSTMVMSLPRTNEIRGEGRTINMDIKIKIYTDEE